MGPDQRLLDELSATFDAELQERLESMNNALVELERGAAGAARRELVELLFRDAHSLKGGAQLLGRGDLATIAHAAETHLDGVRAAGNDTRLELAALFAAVDLMGRLCTGASGAPGELDPVVAVLQGDPGRPVDRPDSALPRAAEPPTEMAPLQPSGSDEQRGERSTVRVSAERLDVLLARSGELIAARDVAVRQQRLLQQLASELAGRQQQWHDLGQEARRLARDVPAGRLRALLDQVDSVHRELGEPERRARAVAREARVAAQRLGQLAERLDAELRDLRMVPVSRLFRQFPRMVRDVAEILDRRVRLDSVGWDTPIDRELLERLKDPVMHLLRNAVDHGIEPADQRRAAGKPAEGVITLEARREGDRIVIEVRDDGRGIDRQRVLARAGAVHGADGQQADRDPALQLIFSPGFSTLASVSPVSGRGVGLDVVATQVAALGGTIGVTSSTAGTAFALRLPLTLISTRVLIVRLGDDRYALPIDAVERVLGIRAEDLTLRGGQQTIDVDGRVLIVADLAATLGLPTTAVEQGRRLTAIVTRAGRDSVALVAEAVEGEREVVVKPLARPVGRVPLIAGAALVEQDELVLVLDQAGLADAASGTQTARIRPRPATRDRRADAERPLRVLVADDSITTRTLEKNILAAAGFDVALAADGREALRAVRLEPFDLVVSDVDMPGVDGFELTQRLRADAATRDLPVILVTSKERPQDRERGLHAGADAYLLKSEFDHQALVRTIREVVG